MMQLFVHLFLGIVFLTVVGCAGGVPVTQRNEYAGAKTMDGSILLILLYLLRRRRRMQSGVRRYWVCPTNARREQQGAWGNLLQEFIDQEPEKFLNYHRLTVEQFHHLLGLIEPLIQRAYVIREPIPAGLKLSLTLRYLASGDSMVSLSYAYRIGRSTMSLIIKETCLAVWEVLRRQVLSPPTTREQWESIGRDFETRWNFPNCMGAIDGKHVVVQCFNGTGSEFFNYKGTFSVSLLAVADAQYRFTFVSLGSKGRESDGGIFSNCEFGKAIASRRLPLPEAVTRPGFPIPLPPVFLGDQAFALLPTLMRPYLSMQRPPAQQRIFNYRLSRARRVIENAFGILASRFRIFRRPIIASIDSVDAIVQATIVLHNWLRNEDIQNGESRYAPPGMIDQDEERGNVTEGTWRQEPPPTGLLPMIRTQSRNPIALAKDIRDNFAMFFMSAGQIPWQWRHLPEF